MSVADYTKLLNDNITATYKKLLISNFQGDLP